MKNLVYFKNYQRKFKIDRDKIGRGIEKILDFLEIGGVSLTFIYFTPAKIKFYNESFRKISAPTDVLSFIDGTKDEEGFTYLGDVIISPHVVFENSKIYNHSDFNGEFIMVHVHGILHLLGYTHGSKDEKVKMFSWQDKILNFLREEGIRFI